jgi:MFS family permease
MTIGYLVVKLLVTGSCGRFIQRYGVRRAVWASGPLYATFFLAFLFCTPERTWPLFAAWAMVGVADAIYSIAVTVALYDAVPDTPGRPIYFAISNVLATGTACVGATAAIPILERLRDTTVHLGPFALDQFHSFYVLCFLIMIPAMFGAVFFPEREKGLSPRNEA